MAEGSVCPCGGDCLWSQTAENGSIELRGRKAWQESGHGQVVEVTEMWEKAAGGGRWAMGTLQTLLTLNFVGYT